MTSIKQHPVASFIVLTLGLSYAAFLLPVPQDPETAFTIVAFVLVMIPTIVAFGLVTLMDGRRGAVTFLRQTFRWRCALKWYLIALAIGFVWQFGSSVLALLTGRIATIQMAAPTVFIIAIFLAALLEEIGWRGFALRRLLDRYSPFAATLIVGVPWALVHFSLYLIFPLGNSPVAEALAVLAFAFALTWIFIKSGRLVLVATVLHGAGNAFGSITGVGAIPAAEANWFQFASACLIIAVLIVIDRRMWFARPAETTAGETMRVDSSLAARAQARSGRRSLRRIGLGMLGFIGLTLSCAVFGMVYEAIMAPGDAARYPAPGQRVDIGGYSLHLNCTGERSPTVILEAGFGARSTDWSVVQPDLSRIRRTCSYDRAGLGWSDPSPEPRDPEHIAIELHTLLTNAGIAGPYVLAGHSIGGKHIRMFTELYPDEVVGLVFVDARHESAEPVGRTPEQNRQDREAYESSLNFYRVLRQSGIGRLFGIPLARMLVPGVENIPDDLLYEGGLFSMRESTLQAMIAESPATTYSDDRLRAARPLGDLPVVVLTAGLSLQQAPNWETVQRNLVALSTNSRWTVVENSLHNIAFDDPDAVIAAVQDVIASARTGRPLASR